jgi:transposase-like protein
MPGPDQAKAAHAAMAARRPSREKIAEMLRESAGVLSVAARRLGFTRSSLYNWIRDDEEMKTLIAEIRDEVTDLAEVKLFENIQKGRSEDIRFYLRCFGKERGYIEVTRIEGHRGGPIEVHHEHTVHAALAHIDPHKLTLDELKMLRALHTKGAVAPPRQMVDVTPNSQAQGREKPE